MGHSVDVPVALGEFIDKITILEIKLGRFADPAMRKNVAAELGLLQARREESCGDGGALCLRRRPFIAGGSHRARPRGP